MENKNGSNNGVGGEAAKMTATADHSKKTVAEVFGEVVWLMSQSPLHKQVFVSDLEWRAMPPILMRQFRLFYGGDKPVGVIFYASLSEEVEKRLEASPDPKLTAQEWQSGDRLWVVEVIAPFGGAMKLLEELSQTALKGKPFKAHVTGTDGKREVKVFG